MVCKINKKRPGSQLLASTLQSPS